MTATVISIVNQKGGVAKTTTAVNLGAGLALRDQKTLLIDFDPQANLSHFLGIRCDSKIPQVGDWIMDKCPNESVIKKTAFENLSIIPSSEDLKGVEMDMQKDFFKAFRYLDKKIKQIKDDYDFILIDNLPSFSLLFMNGIAACDYVLIPAKLEYLSMQGINLLSSKINEICENIKPVKILGIVGTFYRRGVKESDICLEELKKQLPQETLRTVINLNSKLSVSASYSKPIQHFDKNCQGYEDYQSLTEEVLAKCQLQKTLVTAGI